MSERACRESLSSAFEEAALGLAGVVATYPLPDEAIWDLARTLDLIHERAWARYGVAKTGQAGAPEGIEHPAIIHLLARLRGRSAGCSG